MINAECFWFRHPDARIRHLEDVRVVIEHLRQYDIQAGPRTRPVSKWQLYPGVARISVCIEAVAIN
jgi:hypothetical protein